MRESRGMARMAWYRAVPAAVVAGVLLLAGCGGPSWTYVTNSTDRAYLRVPTTWRQVDPGQLEEALGVTPASDSTEGVWIEVYDSASVPSFDHILGDTTAESPAILVSVRPVPEQSRGQISLDTIRDFIHPVSTAARQQDELLGGTSGLTGFVLLADQVLTPGEGIRGVRTVYSYRIGGGPPQIFDQVGFFNDDASKFYFAFARCSAECFDKRQSEIDGVVSSFTVREAL